MKQSVNIDQKVNARLTRGNTFCMFLYALLFVFAATSYAETEKKSKVKCENGTIAQNNIVDIFFDGDREMALRSAKTAFDRIDHDKNGNATSSEFKQFLSAAMLDSKENVSSLVLGKLRRFADNNGSVFKTGVLIDFR